MQDEQFIEEVSRICRLSAQMDAIFDKVVAAHKSGNLGSFFSGIRSIHALNEPAIAAHNYDPYIVDWTRIFTPIEYDAWYSIRTLGLEFYPQFPIGPYFADFANPWRRWVIECDGKQWHDHKRDCERDQFMGELGWEVWRLPGRLLVLGDDDERSAYHLIRDFAGLRDLRAQMCRPLEAEDRP